MHSPEFDVPQAMDIAYNQLRRLGFAAHISVAPAEWSHPVTHGYLRFHHAGGEVTAEWHPHGKSSDRGAQTWRWQHSPGADKNSFVRWLGTVTGRIEEDQARAA